MRLSDLEKQALDYGRIMFILKALRNKADSPKTDYQKRYKMNGLTLAQLQEKNPLLKSTDLSYLTFKGWVKIYQNGLIEITPKGRNFLRSSF